MHMDAETWIQRHGSCRGAWDTKMLRHESEDVDLVADPHWWTLRHESGTWLLQRSLRYEVYRRHKHMTCKQFSCDLSRCLVLGGWRRLMSRIFCCCPPTHCLGPLAGVIFFHLLLVHPDFVSVSLLDVAFRRRSAQEGTIRSALDAADLGKFFDAPLVGKAVGFEGKVGRSTDGRWTKKQREQQRPWWKSRWLMV